MRVTALLLLASVIALCAWFAHGPLAHTLCGTAAPSLEPDRLKEWACARGCDQGSVRDCVISDDLLNHSLDGLHDAGFSVPVPGTADQLADQADEASFACDHGNGTACRTLGDLLDPLAHYGAGDERFHRLFVTALERGCGLGDAPSCTARGGNWPSLGDLPWLVAGCDAGDGLACSGLAHAARRTPGPMGATPEVWRFVERACALAYAEGCREAAEMAEGAASHARSLALDEVGCELGDPLCCHALVREPGEEPLSPGAVSAMKNECAVDPLDLLCYELGERLRTGRGVAADPALAHRLLERVAEFAMSRRETPPAAVSVDDSGEDHNCYIGRY